MDAPMNGGSSSNDAVAATATNAATAATALWGAGSLTERFGNLSGRELQEHCFQMYQVKDGVTVPWFNEAGEKMVIRHHLNLRKQTSVKKAYIRKILAHGIMDGCRSQPWLVQPQPDSSGPYLAITFGTLSEAFYDSCEQFPTNRQVRATKAGGLRNCRIFMDRTPNDVLTFLKDVNNSFHLGSGITFHELVLGVVQVDEAWKAYMERNLLSARSCDRSQFLGWIGSSEFKEKYNGQTFKMAKALRTKLNRLQILNLWDNYFGEETDFLHTDLKSEKALTVMNDLGSMVESYFQGQPVHILGMLFFELCRMAVPLLPAADEDSSHRVPPFLFTKGPESTFFNEATLRLTCPIAGADFVGKLIAPDAAAKAAAKKRPKQPDLTEETEAKRAKKGVAKAKGKAKPQAKPKPESITAESKETVANLQTDIAFKELFGAGEVSSARPRRWMDDLVTCLEKAYGKPLEQPDDSAAGGKTLVGNLLSMGLEFALTGKLTVDKKTYKDWSKVRPLLQTTLHRTMKKFNESSGALGGVGGQGLNDVVNKLLTDISRASSSSGTLVGPQDSMEVVLRKVFDSKSDMTTAQTWVSRNKTDKVINHPAFTEFYNDLKVTIGCSCGQWDVDQCRFHEVCEHGIPDLIWGIKEVMEGEFVGRTGAVPVSLRMVGTAALASGRVVTAKLAEAAASADKEKPEKPLTMADFIGQYGSFLFTKNEINAADPALNTALLQLMISMKARYLLLAMETIVYYSSTSGQDKKKIVYLTDVPRPQALMSLLDWLCNSTSGLKYIVEVESRFQFLVQSSGADSPSQDWGTMWANILSQSLSKEAADSAKRDGGDDPSKVSADIDWKKHVPASSKVVKGKSLVVVSSETTGQGQEDAVKDEADKEQEPKEAAAASATAQPDQASIQSPYTSFADIYAMHEVPQAKSLNSMDVICIGQEIQSYLLKKAASSFAADKVKQLLNAMVVDPKNPGQCILQVPSIKIEDGEAPDARRLWVFGAVTTESGPRSIKVATALFDGDVKIDYYILGNGWEKATCAVPCPVWMCKSGFAEDKALFKGIAEEEQLEFADAHGAKRTVMLQRLGIELRAAAVHTILKKNTSDVICTRSALPGEEAQAKVGKKVAKSTLAIGGAALSTKRTGKGDGDQGKAKAEGGEGTQDDGDAWAWLFKSAPNKCAVHLLR